MAEQRSYTVGFKLRVVKYDPAIVVKAFKKCSISNALDGLEDNALYEDDSDKNNDPFSDTENICDDIES